MISGLKTNWVEDEDILFKLFIVFVFVFDDDDWERKKKVEKKIEEEDA